MGEEGPETRKGGQRGKANAESDRASLRRCLGDLASLKDVLPELSPTTVPMEQFVEDITGFLKDVHEERVKQRLSELKSVGDVMSRHFGGTRGKEDDFPVGSERAFETCDRGWHCPLGVSGWRQFCQATAGLYAEESSTEIPTLKTIEAMTHKVTVTKYTALLVLRYGRNEATPQARTSLLFMRLCMAMGTPSINAWCDVLPRSSGWTHPSKAVTLEMVVPQTARQCANTECCGKT